MQRPKFPVWSSVVFTLMSHSLPYVISGFLVPLKAMAVVVCTVWRIIAKKSQLTFRADTNFLPLRVQVKNRWVTQLTG